MPRSVCWTISYDLLLLVEERSDSFFPWLIEEEMIITHTCTMSLCCKLFAFLHGPPVRGQLPLQPAHTNLSTTHHGFLEHLLGIHSHQPRTEPRPHPHHERSSRLYRECTKHCHNVHPLISSEAYAKKNVTANSSFGESKLTFVLFYVVGCRCSTNHCVPGVTSVCRDVWLRNQ